MNYRPLGQTGLRVSDVGFGAWGIGGTAGDAVAYGPTDDRESLRALRRALDLGVTFYDTAPLYGNGRSEELIGEAFAGRRAAVVLATKVGYLNPAAAQEFTPALVRASLEASLRRLRTDHVDLFQLHDPPMDLLAKSAAILETARALKKEGKTRAVGMTVKSPADGLRAVREFGAEAVQANFNMIDQRAIASGLFAACRETGAAVIARTPLCFGFLSGAYPLGTRFDPKDHRSRWPVRQVALWAGAYKLFEPVIRRQKGQTNAQVAIRYCLSYPEVATVIPGMLTEAHVDENSAAGGQGPLEEKDRREIEGIYGGNTFFVAGDRVGGASGPD